MLQVEVAHALAVIRYDSEEPDALMGNLNVYVRNLRELKKLKNVYECVMSYNEYQVGGTI